MTSDPRPTSDNTAGRPLEIVVYGAGAVGGYLGAKLAQSGNQVSLVARPATAAVLAADGLHVEDAAGSIGHRLPVFGSVREAIAATPAPDLIVLGMKSYDLETALAELAAVCPAPRMVLGTQNGIGVEELIAQCFGAEHVLAGALTLPIARTGANQLLVEKTNRGLGIAPVLDGQRIEPWLRLFQDADINTVNVANYQSMKWSKAFLNIIGNATSAILNMPVDELYADPVVFNLEMRMLEETMVVMRRLGIPLMNLPGAPARWLGFGMVATPRFLLKAVMTGMVVSGRGEKMPSFHIDLYRDKGKSEVVYHNGAIADAGAALGIATPVNRCLNDTLMGMTLHEIDPAEFDHNPTRLVTQLARFEGNPLSEEVNDS